MAEFDGRSLSTGPVAIVVSRYHERITHRLLEGAQAVCLEAGIPADQVDVYWTAGAFELGVVVTACARSQRYVAVVALGVVVRGETPHFDFVAGEASRALANAACETLVPVGFGLLTCDSPAQAMERAGGTAGNKGREAAEAALQTVGLLSKLRIS